MVERRTRSPKRRTRQTSTDGSQSSNGSAQQQQTRTPIRRRRNLKAQPKKHEETMKLNKQEVLLVKTYCHSKQTEDDSYLAFLKTGFIGSKETCDNLFASDRIKKGIKDYNESEKIIVYQSKTNLPTKLTEKTTQKLESALSKGMSKKKAARMVGISPISIDNWRKRGEADISNNNFDTPFARFSFRIDKARSTGEHTLLSCIYDAAMGDLDTEVKRETVSGDGNPTTKEVVIRRRQWQAAAWILERTRPEIYGKNIVPKEEEKPEKQEAKEMFTALNLLIDNKIKDANEEVK